MVVREITKGTIGITDAVMGLYTRYRGDTGDSVVTCPGVGVGWVVRKDYLDKVLLSRIAQ